MTVIILAAGEGTRLRPLTNDRPKCLVQLEGKSLLDHQLAVQRNAGLEDIHVVAGYLADAIDRPGLTRHMNHNFAHTNMVHTLFIAESAMTGNHDLIISYGDIVYEPRVLDALLALDAPIGLTVDTQWQRYWQARMTNPLDDAETLKLVDGNRIVGLGKKPSSYDDIEGQYIGLIKIRADHVKKLAQTWHSMDKAATYDGQDFNNMYMTSFLQYLIDSGWDARAAFIENGWAEIDSVDDLDAATRFWSPTA